jgi:class 3 adenylate cyclase/tetratricopeptide (TPR) repeat protein
VDSVSRWLEELGLSQYAPTFAENDIDEEVLADLADEDLEKLGVTLGHRKKILRALAGRPAGNAYPSTAGNITAEAERRQLTVMFCDLAGSTELSQRLDAEDLREINRAYQDACREAIETFGGFVARYMGDGVLAYFGYPRAHEDDAERGVRAGLDVVARMSALNTGIGRDKEVELAVRVGLATGPVVVGDLIGEGASRESPVVGETPNLAARLQSLADADTVVVTSDTHRLTAGNFRYEDLGEKTLRGIDHPVRIWQVTGASDAGSRFEALHGRRLTPLVGRDREVELLQERWVRAREGSGQLVLISGEAGIGKSRLCEALQECIAAQQYTRLRYQGSPHHVNSVLFPITEQLERAAGIEAHTGAEERLERLEDLLRKSSADIEEDVPLLATLLSIPLNRRYSSLEIDPVEQKERTLESLLRQLEGLCAHRPVLMVFEDLHWVDSSTLELLEKLIERVQTLPVLVLLTFRPEFAPSWADRENVTSLVLSRILEQQCRKMLESVVGADALPERILKEIVAKTDGVPLFIEETGRSVLEAQNESGAGVIDDAHIEVPATLQDSLMARLDRLVIGKQIAQTAAAIGREFAKDLLESVCAMEQGALDRILDELVGSGLIFTRSGGGAAVTYVFQHALLQDAAYNSLLRATRRPIHRRIAEALTTRSPEQSSLLAHHWELAEEFELAFEYRLAAGRRASDLYAVPETITQYLLAMELLERFPQNDDTSRRHLRTVAAVVASTGLTGSATYQHEDQRNRYGWHLDKAIKAATDRGEFALLARLEAYKGGYWMDEASLADAVKHAESSGDKSVQAEVASRYAGFLGRVGRFEDCLVHTDRTIELYGELGEVALQGMALAGEGRCFSARSGRIDVSLRYAARVRDLARETGDPHLAAWKVMETEPYMYKGMWEEVVEISREDLSVAYDSGDWLVVLFAAAWAAIACIKLGQLDEAQVFLDEALTAVEDRVGLDYPRAYIQMVVALLQMESGKIDDACVTARAAVDLAESGGYLVERGAANRTLGEVYAAAGEPLEAEAAFQRSINQLTDIQSRPELAQTFLAYGRFKRGEDVGEGDRMLNRALRMFQQFDAIGWIDETQTVLES